MKDFNTRSLHDALPIVSNPTAVTFSATPSAPSCHDGNDGSITVLAAGGTGTFSYSLDGGPYVATATFNNLTSVTPTAHVKDSTNCAAAQQTITVSNPTA